MLSYLAFSVIALALAACQPTPQPFATERDPAENPLLALADGGGITVRRPDGLAPPDAGRFGEAIAAALREIEIPASTEGANALTRFLTTRVATQGAAQNRVNVALDWSLADAKGGRAASGTLTTAADAGLWSERAPELLKRLAAEIADAVAKSSAAGSGAATVVKPATERPLHVAKIAGVPARDEPALRRSLEYQLRQAKLRVADDLTHDALVVAGNFALSPPANGSQKVELRWALLRRDGAELGTLTQANAVPAGTFEKPWGELAVMIAQGAAAGGGEIPPRVPPEKLADRPGR